MAESLESYNGAPFVINEMATNLNVPWHRSRVAVTKLIDLGLLEIAEQSWTGFTFYRKTKTFKSKLKQLRKENILT